MSRTILPRRSFWIWLLPLSHIARPERVAETTTPATTDINVIDIRSSISVKPVCRFGLLQRTNLLFQAGRDLCAGFYQPICLKCLVDFAVGASFPIDVEDNT